MSNSYQSEIPKARVNIQLSLHTGGAQKKVELPLKLMVVGDYSNGAEQRAVSEREKVNINKNNFDNVLAEFSPSVNLAVKNTLAGDGSEENILNNLPPPLSHHAAGVTPVVHRPDQSFLSPDFSPRCSVPVPANACLW